MVVSRILCTFLNKVLSIWLSPYHAQPMGWDAYPFQDMASVRVRHGQLTRLDLHQLDCGLVGRSPHPTFRNF
jgi:hypothetical protein